ncbi:hypothetical protein BOO21_14170 [Vibrio cidicii]|nr:hypothetical protein [Vibrio cidicii]
MHIYSFFLYFNRVAEGKIGIRNWAASDCKIRAQVGVFGGVNRADEKATFRKVFLRTGQQ